MFYVKYLLALHFIILYIFTIYARVHLYIYALFYHVLELALLG